MTLGWAVSWWYTSSLAAAENEIRQGRYSEARGRLGRLASWWPGRAEVEFPLGVCEMATGHSGDALMAWSRVPSDSPRADDASLRSAEVLIDEGRLGDAERVLSTALARTGRHSKAIDLRHDLLQLHWQQGRLDEVRELIERNWRDQARAKGADSRAALSNLRAHLSLDLEVYPVGRVEELLTRAGKLAPGDARVALGKANLATRTGRIEEARARIDNAVASKPDDAAVWRAGLDLALASGDVDLASRAARRLETSDLSLPRLEQVRAWFAARRGDTVEERLAWGRFLAADASNAAALERLTELAAEQGQVARAGELRVRKTEIDRTLRLYSARVGSDYQAGATDMARMA